ncbi:immunity protein SdpI [Maritalea myrionectae]|uniref:Immunity protein SdpI n=1 Tax=Maritalea myrionectae TaxID=454601 RepID=A0A2R4MFM6_9HYPH|nr:SdpI family protein [Maritalea myrionectae]AVX04773.1 immunity protein SdpI [Maritalea myrionectae]
MTNSRILNRVHTAQIIAICAIAGLGYIMLDPNQPVPIHWNLWGEVDNRWPAKWALLIGPVLSLAFFAGALAIGRREKGSWLAPLTTSMLALFILLEMIMLLTGLGVGLNVPRIITMAIGLLLVVIGNYLPKSQPNNAFGIRYPWTLRNERVWAQTNLFAGWFFMLVGIGCVLFAALLEVAAPFYFAILISGLVAALIIISAYSYQLSKKLKS